MSIYLILEAEYDTVVKAIARGEEAAYDYHSFFFKDLEGLNAFAARILKVRMSDPYMINARSSTL
jgi:hypothetical protein